MVGKTIPLDDVTYTITKKLGNGGFGYVFLAKVEPTPECTRTLPDSVAIKVEQTFKLSRPQLEYEKRVYQTILRKIRKEDMNRVPLIYDFIEESPAPSYKSLVMERMSYNLMELFESYQNDVDRGTRAKPFQARDVYLVFAQALDCLRAVHSCGFVHRDIKPENFCVRGDDNNTLCIVDFGLCKRFTYRDGKHIKFRQNKSLLGTPRYMSLNCHDGYELSRRDDIESLLYMVLFFLNPKLPWQNLKIEKCSNTRQRKKKKYAKIAKLKRSASDSGSLFAHAPPPFRKTYNQVRAMGFDERPNYTGLKRAVRESLLRAECLSRQQRR